MMSQQIGDLISREDTLTAFSDYVGSGMSMNDFYALWDIVAKMPSVNPQEPKGGHWISEKVDGEDWKGCKRQYYQPISCSKCHSPNHYKSAYCPNCGARMESEDEE